MEPIEKLTIDTPEQVALEFPLAGVGSRFLAFAIDTLLQAVIVIGVFFVGLIALPGFSLFGSMGPSWGLAIGIVIWFVLYWAYFAGFEALWKGQTPGKRELRLRVIKDTGASITAQDAMARNLLRAVDSLPGFYGVGLVVMFLSSQNKRLGDYVAGTVVVHERPPESEKVYWNTQETQDTQQYPVAKLVPEQIAMSENFLARRLDLDSELRYRLARELADHLAMSLQLRPEERPRDEELIETVVRQYRRSASFHS
ncbi:MAG TPA: RDD family protein [Terriglobales bacterium]|nr:RDD family protein [Terriglobales bacterium]